MANFWQRRKESRLKRKLEGDGFRISVITYGSHETMMRELDIAQKRVERGEISGYAVIQRESVMPEERVKYEMYILPK